MATRVLQASAWYPPAHLGGTEIYVSGLVKELRAHNVVSRVITPGNAGETCDYEFDGTTVRVYPVNNEPSPDELQDAAPHRNFERFLELLEEEKPDVYHQHSWTRGLGRAHLRAAREAGLKTVITLHIPNAICMRGTMMRFGKEACDGRIDAYRCAACWSEERGMPGIFAHGLAAIPASVGKSFEGACAGSRIATAISARARAERHERNFRQLAEDADRVVAVSGWLFEALRANDAPSDKLMMSRQGVDTDFAARASMAVSARNGTKEPFSIVYLGRWHPVKGIDVLVRAAKAIPDDVHFSLAIHGVGNGAEESAYAAHVRQLSQGDGRIAIKEAIGRDKLPTALAAADALAVPSLWLETGPLVVLEAKSAGLPVIGSRLGGIAELVHEPEDGILVAPGDVAAWTRAIQTMIARRGERKPATASRTMRDVAAEMAALYSSLA